MHDPTVPDEFSKVPACPKCGGREPRFDYRSHREFKVCDGLVDARQVGSESLECFLVTCMYCHYQWTMETKDTQELRR